MRQSNLLVLNTIAVYLRTLLAVPLGMLTVRFAFGELGEIDYGLWSTIGATTALMAIVTNAMVQSAQRHLAYEVGAGDAGRLKSVFRTLLALFLMITIGLGVVGVLIAPLILSGLNIPDDRATAAWWVLHLSLSAVMANTCVTPYRALLTAHQRLTTLASVDFLATLFAVANAWCLRYAQGDQLITYVAINLIINLSLGMLVAGLTFRILPVSRTLPRLGSMSESLDVGTFALWSFLSNMAGVLRSKGSIVVVNVAFGPAATAGLALAIQAHNVLYRTASALNSSISPALTNFAGKRDTASVRRLMNLGCKVPFLAASLFYTPLMLDCDSIFDLWLSRDIPADTIIHTRLLGTMALFGIASWGHHLVLSAENRIALVSNVLLATIAGGLLIAWFGCKTLGWPAWAVSASMCLCTIFLTLSVRPIMASQLLECSYFRLIFDSLGRSFMAAIPCYCLAAGVQALLPEGGVRLLCLTLAYAITLPAAAWYIAFDAGERSAFTDLGSRAIGRLRSRFSNQK